jgi:hypothetical protein
VLIACLCRQAKVGREQQAHQPRWLRVNAANPDAFTVLN